MFRESDVTLTTTAETTWQDMLNDKTNMCSLLPLTGSPRWKSRKILKTSAAARCSPYILGDLADYSSEKLLFTEDELFAAHHRRYRVGCAQ